MLTYYSDDHHLHHGKCELIDGQLMPCFEKPQRADHILARVKARQLGEVRAPKDFGLAPIARIHSKAYLEFFQGAWARWQEQGGKGDLLPFTWPARTLRRMIPNDLHGQLGYYSFDAGVPITAEQQVEDVLPLPKQLVGGGDLVEEHLLGDVADAGGHGHRVGLRHAVEHPLRRHDGQVGEHQGDGL